MDNATNNDSVLQFIGVHLKQFGIHDFKPRHNHVHCFGHIRNLFIKAFLWGQDVDAYEREIAQSNEYQEDIAELL